MNSRLGIGAVLAAGLAVGLSAQPAQAQSPEGYRRFTAPIMDPNRNHKFIYAPVLMRGFGQRPTTAPGAFANASALWFDIGDGAAGRKPEQAVKGVRYVLNEFDVVQNGGNGSDYTVISLDRFPAPAPTTSPEVVLELVNRNTRLGQTVRGTATPIQGGVRYYFQVNPPETQGYSTRIGANTRFDVRLFGPEQLETPQNTERLPTFGRVRPEEFDTTRRR